MKKLSLFILLLMPSLLMAQKGLLWKVSGNGLEKPSYLFGTMHIICNDSYFEPAGFRQSLSASEAVCLEIDITSPDMAVKMQKAMVDPQLRNFKDELDPKAVAGIDSLMHKYMMAGIDKLGILKPWAVATSFSVLTMLDCPDQRQYETELAMYAKQEEKPILALETIDFQINMFDNWERADQIRMVNDIVLSKDEQKDIFRRLLGSYVMQDLDALYLLNREKSEYLKYHKVMIDDRNISWIPVMGQMMTEKSVFFAVGAAHLGGENGVISLLRNAGYKVERIEE